MSLRILILGLLGAVLLSGCGFQLRGDADLPPEMDSTQLVVDDRNSVLVRRLMTQLEQQGVRFVDDEDATAILEIPVNRVVTEVLTIGNNARVQEYRITHTVEFRLTEPDGTELLPTQTLSQAREISFNQQKILATSREQEYLKDDLAESLSRIMVTRLESISGTRS